MTRRRGWLRSSRRHRTCRRHKWRRRAARAASRWRPAGRFRDRSVVRSWRGSGSAVEWRHGQVPLADARLLLGEMLGVTAGFPNLELVAGADEDRGFAESGMSGQRLGQDDAPFAVGPDLADLAEQRLECIAIRVIFGQLVQARCVILEPVRAAAFDRGVLGCGYTSTTSEPFAAKIWRYGAGTDTRPLRSILLVKFDTKRATARPDPAPACLSQPSGCRARIDRIAAPRRLRLPGISWEIMGGQIESGPKTEFLSELSILIARFSEQNTNR